MDRDQIIADLKAKHPDVDVYAIRSGEDEVFVRLPTPEEMDRFAATGGDKSRGLSPMRQLVADCVLHPHRDVYDAMARRRAALPIAFGGELLKLAGMSEATEGKRL